MCRSSSFPLQASATSDLRFARDPVRRDGGALRHFAAKALESLGISLEAVREKVEETIGTAGTAPSGSPPFTPRAKRG